MNRESTDDLWLLFSILGMAFVLNLGAPATATLLRVPQDYSSIAAGLAAATSGDTVLVAPGTYYECGLDVDGESLTLLGTPADVGANGPQTVIDGRYEGTILRAAWLENGPIVVQNLTFIHGYGVQDGAFNPGGAIDFRFATGLVLNCEFRENSVRVNGGSAIGCYSSTQGAGMIIENCRFIDNLAPSTGSGAILWFASNGRISDCEFVRNRAYVGPSAVEFDGGQDVVVERCVFEDGEGSSALSSSRVDLKLARSIFRNNEGANGAGLLAYDGEFEISHCWFSGNRADRSGGGILLSDSPKASIRNTVVIGNVGSGSFFGGAGIRVTTSRLDIENCTIANNRADNGRGGGIWVSSGPCKITGRNNIIVGNYPEDEQIFITEGNVWMDHSNVEGGWPGEGNIDVDPGFLPRIKPTGFLLGPGSPCVDSGDPALSDRLSDWHPLWPEQLPNGSRSDMGAFGGAGNWKWVLMWAKFADQLADLHGHRGAPRTASLALPCSVTAESAAVPVHHGLGPNEVEVVPPAGPNPRD